MHFEILVEGQCELTALSILLPKIIGGYRSPHTWKIHKHRGVGAIPVDLNLPADSRKMGILDQLPYKLRSYSKTYTQADARVIVLVDIDDKDIHELTNDLERILPTCAEGFTPYFLFACEELESWYLGDRAAIIAFNQNSKLNLLDGYQQDSICGAWEFLATVFGITLGNKRNYSSLDIKKEWSKSIPPLMEIEHNISPSFNKFVQTLKDSV